MSLPSIKEYPGLKAIKKTIPLTFSFLNENIKNVLRTFRQDYPLTTTDKGLKLYNEKVLQLYVNISSELNSSKY